ncbi:hypothetical protein ACI8EP_11920 [Klebsiella michiganensis]
MELTISFSTIIMACLSFMGVYILMPIVLIGRDYVVMLISEKFIVTEAFWQDIADLSRDKVNYNIMYGSKNFRWEESEGEVKYFWGENEITENDYNHHQKNKSMLLNSMNTLNYRVQSRMNICVWVERHFKLKETIDEQVREASEHAYESALSARKQREELNKSPANAGRNKN